MVDDACLVHDRKFSFGDIQLVRVQSTGFGRNRRARVCEKMVADWIRRWRGCETMGGENVRKL